MKREVVRKSPSGCWGEAEIVCPYCHYKFGEDSYFQHEDGYQGSGFDVDCLGCEKTFRVEPDYEISYTSYPYKEIDDGNTSTKSDSSQAV